MKYNLSQKEAICHGKGPMLVLAGPGSGKTAVITRRTKYLIEEHGVDPRNILVITFTKAAAEEMKERFYKIMGGVKLPVTFGTFHAVFFMMLKYAYHYDSNNIVREDQKKQYFREIIEKLDLEIEDEKDFIMGIESEISLVKGERMNLEHYYSTNCSEENFKKIYDEYDKRLRGANLIDFDDMLVLCYELLSERQDILKLWQDKYRYILIDEFQDINKVQYDIVKLLSKPEDNLFIVGDDDQSIYRFRGAKPEIMLNFHKDYLNTKKVLLDVNYRCSPAIVECGGKVIKNNKNRFPKKITTPKEPGSAVRIRGFNQLLEENKLIVEEILEYHKNGISFSEIAVLFRTNTQPRALLERLMEYNIPFRMKDNIPNIYEHWIASNIIDYIKIALGNRERGLFLRIANRPKRYINRDCLNNPTVEFSQIKKYYSDKYWMIERIEKMEYDIKLLQRMNPYAAIEYIRKGIGYEDYLKEYAEYRRINIEELMDTLGEIQETARNYLTFEEWFGHIEEYGKELQLQMRNNKNKDKDSVTMATMHSAKGLEYRVVFIIDVNEGIIPHRKALLEEDVEEERRMFYVAVTRAKEELHIYFAKSRYNKELEVSRFIGEIMLDKEGLKAGVRIEHKIYGQGTITKCENEKLVIYFDKLKKNRVLNLDFCLKNQLLKIIGEG